MAHMRQRQVDALFSRLAAFSPIVGVFGHRQVGKSTFASGLDGTYLTFDDRATRERVAEDPSRFLTGRRTTPTVIDECQLEPDLFPALKEYVRTHPRPGQFVLSGSVRFTSRRAIRESLAGRISTIELFPLVLSELMRVPLPDILPQLLEAGEFTESTLSILRPTASVASVQKQLEKYLLVGGLPGLCFIREERLRQEALADLHRLILDRDLRLVVETRLSLETLMRWLRWISQHGWNPYNASEARREFGLAPQTQKSLLFALESIFLIRRIPLYGGRKGETILMEDQYEERTLSGAALTRPDQVLSAFFRNARAQFNYRLGDPVRFESYWTRSGARIPLVIRGSTRALGFGVVSGEKPTLSQLRAAESFLRHEPRGNVIFIADHPRPPRLLDPRILLCAAAALI